MTEGHALAWFHPTVVVWPSLPFSLGGRLQSARKLYQVIRPSGKQYKPIRGKSCLPGEVWAIMALPVCYYSLSAWVLRCDFLLPFGCFSFYSFKCVTVFVACVAQRKGQFDRMESLGHGPHCHLPLHGSRLWRCWEFLSFILSWQLRLLRPIPCPFETYLT